MSGPAQPNVTASHKDANTLHLEFVAMLFALAAAEVATETAHFAEAWRVQGKFDWAWLPGISHLLLALLVIASSWVGWNLSEDHGSKRSAKLQVFSLDFIEMTLDVILVIFYFLLVKATEVPTKENGYTVTPAFRCDLAYVAIIFALYVAWDLVSKLEKIVKGDTGRIGRVMTTALSFIISVGIAVYFWSLPERFGTVLAIDGLLACFVLFYRALKGKQWVWVAATSAGGMACAALASFL